MYGYALFHVTYTVPVLLMTLIICLPTNDKIQHTNDSPVSKEDYVWCKDKMQWDEGCTRCEPEKYDDQKFIHNTNRGYTHSDLLDKCLEEMSKTWKQGKKHIQCSLCGITPADSTPAKWWEDHKTTEHMREEPGPRCYT